MDTVEVEVLCLRHLYRVIVLKNTCRGKIVIQCESLWRTLYDVTSVDENSLSELLSLLQYKANWERCVR